MSSTKTEQWFFLIPVMAFMMLSLVIINNYSIGVKYAIINAAIVYTIMFLSVGIHKLMSVRIELNEKSTITIQPEEPKIAQNLLLKS